MDSMIIYLQTTNKHKYVLSILFNVKYNNNNKIVALLDD
jgi:hypothetical protein